MKEIDKAVIRFSGDSGDGMQLTGTQFSNTSALMGNDIATFPDFPAEIRAPQGTVAGVSGFQVHIGSTEIYTPGDEPDVLVAMNPAALKANISDLRKGGAVILNMDAFNKSGYEKAGYETSPLEDNTLNDYQVIEANITEQTKTALEEVDLDNKAKVRCKNFYALGMTYFMFDRSLDPTLKWIEDKFKNKPTIIEANQKALKAGYNYAITIDAQISNYKVPSAKIGAGKYRQINGNTSTAWGFIQAAKASGRDLFLGSYPITPASDILHELSKYKHFGVKTFQAEDEIAGVCSAIGAAFGGALAITSSSGPGVALKGEALGLAMMYELPLVLINVQRGGPSTGLPTKTEQSDLNLCMFGRNGESPMIVLAASRPNDCFHMAYEAARLSLQHMTPVCLLTDGYIANGSEPWMIPDLEKEYPAIQTRLLTDAQKEEETFFSYQRDQNTLARVWAIPGDKNREHRLGGLEKDDITGNVSYDPENHEKMVHLRQKKVELVANNIPEQDVVGDDKGDLLVVSWGGTYGATFSAVKQAQEEGYKVSLAHLRYINPFPKNFPTLINNFKRILVPELNNGQLKDILNAKFQCDARGFNKIQGQPFKVSEVLEEIKRCLS